MNVVTKKCMLIVDTHKYGSESHMVGFLGRFLMYECVRFYLRMYYCMGL